MPVTLIEIVSIVVGQLIDRWSHATSSLIFHAFFFSHRSRPLNAQRLVGTKHPSQSQHGG